MLRQENNECTPQNKQPKVDDQISKTNKDEKDAVDISAEQRIRPRKEVSKEALSIYLTTGDASKALERLPKNCYIERTILQYLAKHAGEFLGCLLRLPANSLSLYVHAAQSIVWNRITSIRLEKYGREPVEGDFVYFHQNSDNSGGYDPAELKDSVFRLSESDIENKVYRITDIILPLPGDSVTYPDFLRAEYEEESRRLLNIELSDFKVCE